MSLIRSSQNLFSLLMEAQLLSREPVRPMSSDWLGRSSFNSLHKTSWLVHRQRSFNWSLPKSDCTPKSRTEEETYSRYTETVISQSHLRPRRRSNTVCLSLSRRRSRILDLFHLRPKSNSTPLLDEPVPPYWCSTHILFCSPLLRFWTF
jgi:hypothetical protein